MPLYEFSCAACGERSEVRLGFADPQPEVCTACGGELRRVFSPPQFSPARRTSDPLNPRAEDWLSRPETFSESMKAFEDRTGLGLTKSELDGAVGRLEQG